jgi:imidazolonepropionase-like amidohydrolase
MKATVRQTGTVLTALGVAMTVVAARADAPHVYAITGARIVTAAGPAVASGTVVIRNGVIDAVGASVPVPDDAVVIEAKGATIYPGLIDMGSSVGVSPPALADPRNGATREEVDRWYRTQILRPDVTAATAVQVDAPDLTRRATAGITTVLATPPGAVVRGQSALVNVAAPAEDPQIGDIATPRRGTIVVKSPVALHVAFATTPSRFRAFPESLMGVIAFVRQAFLDAKHYQLEQQYYSSGKGGATRPADDPALAAMQPAVDGKLPVAFDVDAAREIRRALAMARELKLDPIITSAREAGDVTQDLKAANARVVLSLDYPVRSKALAPDADESLRVLRERANAPKAAAALESAGILFAFESKALKEPRDFVRNAARAVKAGLPAEAAVRALTINAAKIAGVADRLGSIEQGKIANVIVTDGDLFEDKTSITHVFIDGRRVALDKIPEQRRSTTNGQ